jgi:hypothetical protein
LTILLYFFLKRLLSLHKGHDGLLDLVNVGNGGMSFIFIFFFFIEIYNNGCDDKFNNNNKKDRNRCITKEEGKKIKTDKRERE